MTTATITKPATRLVSSVSEADQPYWGDLVKWRAARSALRGAIDTGRHLIGGMLPKADAAGRVVEADGLCMRCGSVLLIAFDFGAPLISGKARREHCIPRDRGWADAGAHRARHGRPGGLRPCG